MPRRKDSGCSDPRVLRCLASAEKGQDRMDSPAPTHGAPQREESSRHARLTLSHLSDHELLRELAALVANDRTTTAALLAHLAEIDARRLYLPAGYPSMFVYCVEVLRLSE